MPYHRTLGVAAAAAGAAALGVYLYALRGHSPLDRVPLLWALAVGVFAEAAPAVALLHDLSQQRRLGAFLRGYPKWAIVAAVALQIATSTASRYAFAQQPFIPPETSVMNRRATDAAHAARDAFFAATWLQFYGLATLFWLLLPREPALTSAARTPPAAE